MPRTARDLFAACRRSCNSRRMTLISSRATTSPASPDWALAVAASEHREPSATGRQRALTRAQRVKRILAIDIYGLPAMACSTNRLRTSQSPQTDAMRNSRNSANHAPATTNERFIDAGLLTSPAAVAATVATSTFLTGSTGILPDSSAPRARLVRISQASPAI